MKIFNKFTKFAIITSTFFLFITAISFADTESAPEFTKLIDAINHGRSEEITELVNPDISYTANYGDFQESYEGIDEFLKEIQARINDSIKFDITNITTANDGIFTATGIARDFSSDIANMTDGIRIDFNFSILNGKISRLEYFENQEDLNTFFDNFSGTVGIIVEFVDDKLLVRSLMEGKSAKLSGIKENDVIVAIDDMNVSEMTHGADEMLYRIKGPDKTNVKLKVDRNGELLNFDLLRTVTDRDLLYQVSTIQSLIAGNYDGSKTVSRLKEMGDFGIGTFDGLDGELVMIDGKVYKVKDTGAVEEVENDELIPFAAVTFLDVDLSAALVNVESIEELKSDLDTFITNKDAFYGFRIEGLFKTVKARSVPEQSKPYPILSEVTKNQSVFEYENVEGSLIGFWCPEYIGGVNVPEYHLHFISNDRKLGGHLLDVTFDEAQVFGDITLNFNMELPETTASNTIENVESEIEKVE